jgi:phage replication-related protein YjqB (UPF0714/DUF867 family)
MTDTRSGPRFLGYADLARVFRRGQDYDITVRRQPGARIAVIAPHGGRIENGTSEVARGIAGDDFHLYLFEGALAARNFHTLHLTSHLFDEPECLQLIAASPVVIAVHGCSGDGERAFLGGLDVALRDRLAAALRAANVPADTDGHPFPAVRATNVCNRGARGMGVQIELTQSLRDGPESRRVVDALRPQLLAIHDA